MWTSVRCPCSLPCSCSRGGSSRCGRAGPRARFPPPPCMLASSLSRSPCSFPAESPGGRRAWPRFPLRLPSHPSFWSCSGLSWRVPVPRSPFYVGGNCMPPSAWLRRRSTARVRGSYGKSSWWRCAGMTAPTCCPPCWSFRLSPLRCSTRHRGGLCRVLPSSLLPNPRPFPLPSPYPALCLGPTPRTSRSHGNRWCSWRFTRSRTVAGHGCSGIRTTSTCT